MRAEAIIEQQNRERLAREAAIRRIRDEAPLGTVITLPEQPILSPAEGNTEAGALTDEQKELVIVQEKVQSGVEQNVAALIQKVRNENKEITDEQLNRIEATYRHGVELMAWNTHKKSNGAADTEDVLAVYHQDFSEQYNLYKGLFGTEGAAAWAMQVHRYPNEDIDGPFLDTVTNAYLYATDERGETHHDSTDREPVIGKIAGLLLDATPESELFKYLSDYRAARAAEDRARRDSEYYQPIPEYAPEPMPGQYPEHEPEPIPDVEPEPEPEPLPTPGPEPLPSERPRPTEPEPAQPAVPEIVDEEKLKAPPTPVEVPDESEPETPVQVPEKEEGSPAIEGEILPPEKPSYPLPAVVEQKNTLPATLESLQWAPKGVPAPIEIRPLYERKHHEEVEKRLALLALQKVFYDSEGHAPKSVVEFARQLDAFKKLHSHYVGLGILTPEEIASNKEIANTVAIHALFFIEHNRKKDAFTNFGRILPLVIEAGIPIWSVKLVKDVPHKDGQEPPAMSFTQIITVQATRHLASAIEFGAEGKYSASPTEKRDAFVDTVRAIEQAGFLGLDRYLSQSKHQNIVTMRRKAGFNIRTFRDELAEKHTPREQISERLTTFATPYITLGMVPPAVVDRLASEYEPAPKETVFNPNWIERVQDWIRDRK